MDDKIWQMLQQLGRTLSTSSEIRETVRKIRQQGYSLYLDCKQDGGGGAQIELTPPALPPAREPAFRLDGKDVTFLKSLGIDPTRPGPRRRNS